LICSLSGVAATEAGMMKGTLLEGLPSASSTSPKGRWSSRVKVLRSTGAIRAVWAMRSLPSGSRLPHRLRDSTASSDTTGLPSCHFRPLRSVNAHLSPADVNFSTICGLTWSLASVPNSVS
jgi:hypothetical protein